MGGLCSSRDVNTACMELFRQICTRFINISFHMQCMIIHKHSTYSACFIQLLHILYLCTQQHELVLLIRVHREYTSVCKGTKRLYLRHHFNNFQPAMLVLPALAGPCYQPDRLSRPTSSFHTIAHQAARRYTISPEHHASNLTGSISVAAHAHTTHTHTHTHTHTQAHMHRQMKSMATFLHIRKCCTVGGQWRSPPTHRIFNCKHV